ncbi:MAG: outer membrane beta-barrel protein [Ferruginibacter sp.]
MQKGYKNTYQSGAAYVKVRLNYIEVPLNFVYNIPAGAGKVYLGLGPNFGLGLSGKSRYYVNSNLLESRDVKFDGDTDDPNSNNDHLKRFDFGGNLLAGYTCNMGLTFGVSFTLGLTDVSPNKLDSNDPDADGFTEKNHSLNFKIGYLFGGTKGAGKATTSTGTTGSIIF